jgi:hypothetical protein
MVQIHLNDLKLFTCLEVKNFILFFIMENRALTWHKLASINSMTKYTSANSARDFCGVKALSKPIIWKWKLLESKDVFPLYASLY